MIILKHVSLATRLGVRHLEPFREEEGDNQPTVLCDSESSPFLKSFCIHIGPTLFIFILFLERQFIFLWIRFWILDFGNQS